MAFLLGLAAINGLHKRTTRDLADEIMLTVQEEIARCKLPLEVHDQWHHPLREELLPYLTIRCDKLGGLLAVYIGGRWRPFFYILPSVRSGPYWRTFRRGSYDWRKAVLTRLKPDPDLKEQGLLHYIPQRDGIVDVHPMQVDAASEKLKKDIRDHRLFTKTQKKNVTTHRNFSFRKMVPADWSHTVDWVF